MAVYHWCDRCDWVDETEMVDVRTCGCGRRVDVSKPREPFSQWYDRNQKPGERLVIIHDRLSVLGRMRAWLGL